ncbi:glycosyl transferase [Aquimarina aggregata]|uniref:Glycosyl transferase n=1 Tax=Aquimarina aggregata TaxID=1642818 RepID=A0A163BDV3_9FLAO|nr:glycosyltransferase family 2 protein [Aquimarina aggregata]KZS41292.1 glycosyl transferase [Aquimarina aggregata]
MKLSIVTTLYKSEGFVQEFYERVHKTTLKITEDYEIIFVNDGSPDYSRLKVLEIRDKDTNVKLVDLSRNFGHHYAIQAGLSISDGDIVFLIDCDLETPPEVLEKLYAVFDNKEKFDVVYAYQEVRKGNWFEQVSGDMFYTFLNALSETLIPRNILTERIMRKKYVDSLLELGDANLFLGGMMYWVGYHQKGIPISKSQRKGKSTYTLKKRISLLINAVASFSAKPLTWLFNFGVIISLLSFVTGGLLILVKMYYGEQIQVGWTSLLVINILILGIISTFLGVIGIYMYKIFKQVQNRPNFIIKKIYE